MHAQHSVSCTTFTVELAEALLAKQSPSPRGLKYLPLISHLKNIRPNFHNLSMRHQLSHASFDFQVWNEMQTMGMYPSSRCCTRCNGLLRYCSSFWGQVGMERNTCIWGTTTYSLLWVPKIHTNFNELISCIFLPSKPKGKRERGHTNLDQGRPWMSSAVTQNCIIGFFPLKNTSF